MAVEERRRLALRQQIVATWGEEAAETLFELVTPAGHEPATRHDIRHLEERMDAGFASLEGRMDAGFAIANARFEAMGDRLEALEHRLVGTFERRIADAVTTQTRTLVLSQLGAIVVIAGLAFGLQ